MHDFDIKDAAKFSIGAFINLWVIKAHSNHNSMMIPRSIPLIDASITRDSNADLQFIELLF